MNHPVFRCTPVLLASLLTLAMGCQTEAPQIAASPPERGPEEKLATILSLVRDGVGDTSMGDQRRSDAVPGGLQPQWTTRVLEELHEPRNPGDNYRATIRIITEGSLMVRIRPRVDETEEAGRGKKLARYSADGELPELRLSDDEGTFLSDEDFSDAEGGVPVARERGKRPVPPSVRTVDSRTEKVFELVYENDQWSMLTEFEEDSPDIELYVTSFERALRLQ